MLVPYLFIICLDYVLRTSIDKIRENSFELKKKRSRRYPAKTITDTDYADDIAILANTPNQAETLLHSLERAAAVFGLHVNAHKTEHMCYKQTGDISTLDGTSLKLVDMFTYLGSSVSSTEKDIDTRLMKLSIGFRSYGSQTWPIKWNVVSSRQRSYWYCYMDALLGHELNSWRGSWTAITQECCEQYWTSPGSNTQQGTNYTATCLPSWKLSKLDKPDMHDAAGEAGTNS